MRQRMAQVGRRRCVEVDDAGLGQGQHFRGGDRAGHCADAHHRRGLQSDAVAVDAGGAGPHPVRGDHRGGGAAHGGSGAGVPGGSTRPATAVDGRAVAPGPRDRERRLYRVARGSARGAHVGRRRGSVTVTANGWPSRTAVQPVRASAAVTAASHRHCGPVIAMASPFRLSVGPPCRRGGLTGADACRCPSVVGIDDEKCLWCRGIHLGSGGFVAASGAVVGWVFGGQVCRASRMSAMMIGISTAPTSLGATVRTATEIWSWGTTSSVAW